MVFTSYPPAIRNLLSTDRLPPLGPGSPNESVRAQLEALTIETVCAPHSVKHPDSAAACLAGLWLYHDFLDESHKISQELHVPTGSYWHGILHRREPDYDNAKYWFRRVGTHPVYEPLCRDAAALAVESPPEAAFLRTQSTWNAFAFVDLCAAALAGRAPCVELCLRVQKREWELLFDWCYRQATEAG